MITYILRQNDVEVDRDFLTTKAATELIVGAIVGLVPDSKSAQEQVHGILKAIQEGQTVEIKNPATSTAMIFQIPSLKKEREALR